MATSKKKPTENDDDGLVTHISEETPEQVAEYWTPERMREAKPVPMPTVVEPDTGPSEDEAGGKSPKRRPKK